MTRFSISILVLGLFAFLFAVPASHAAVATLSQHDSHTCLTDTDIPYPPPPDTVIPPNDDPYTDSDDGDGDNNDGDSGSDDNPNPDNPYDPENAPMPN